MPALKPNRRLTKFLADPPAVLALIAVLSGLAHLGATRLLGRDSGAVYAIFFFSASAALIISFCRLFRRRGRRQNDHRR